MRIELDHLPHSDLNPNKRLHYMKVYQAKRDAKDEAMILVLAQGRPEKAHQKAHITITWVARTKRRRDIDNLFASMKAYVDGLVDVGLLADDSASHVSYTLKYELGEANNTIIEVEEIR